MAAFSTLAAVAIGGAGAIGAVSASNAQRSAARSAANASQRATDESIQFLREGRDIAERELRPFASAGVDALAEIRELLGLPAQAPSQQDLRRSDEQLRAAYPELAQAYDAWGSAFDSPNGQGYGGSFAAFVSEREGAEALFNPAPEVDENAPTGWQASYQSRLLDDAAASFEASPWNQFNQQATADAVDNLDARYGASGLMLSGQAVRARAEIAARLKGEAFDRHYTQQAGAKADYLSSLYALAGSGQNAASGIATGGANFANGAVQALSNNAANQANAYMARAAGQQQMMSDLLGFGGWALGQGDWGRPQPTTTTTGGGGGHGGVGGGAPRPVSPMWPGG